MLGRAGGVAHWTRRAFTSGSNDTAEVMRSFQETAATAPRKTAENIVKHHDGGVGSVIAGCRAFAVHGPMVRNSLPDDLRAQQDYVPFKQGLKTWLFSRY